MYQQLKKIKNGRSIILAVIIVVCLIFALHHHHKKTPPIKTALPKIEKPTQPSVVKSDPWYDDPALSFTKITVKRGDTLYKIFKNHDIPYSTLKKVLAQPDAKKYLSQLHPGESFYLHNDPQAQQMEIKYPINGEKTLYLYSDQGKISSHLDSKKLTKHLLYKEATISHSFAETAHNAGLTHAQTYQLSKIFEGNVNFSRDIRPGDHFSILYDEYYLHDKKQRPGYILAATFTNRGKTYTALRFTYPHHHTGYYTPNGRGVEPLFTMHPVKYTRISSYFTMHRYDPVLHIVHPHLGIDFAAPIGTPIKSIGDGKVIYHGWKGGYGKAVVIRYSKKYKTLYGHMSHFAKNLRNGQSVKKGQVIGYIGSSGWSTGPHLHFEMYVYGIPRDPLKMKFISGKPIPKSYLPAFHEKADAMLAYLKMYQGQEFAMVDEKGHAEE